VKLGSGEWHNALELLAMLAGIDVDRESSGAEQWFIATRLAPLRHAAHLQLARALYEHQLNGSVALQLQRDAWTAFEACCEQHGCGDTFSEQPAHRFGVNVLCEHLLPGFLESHERAANLQVLENERLDFVQLLTLRASAAGSRWPASDWLGLGMPS